MRKISINKKLFSALIIVFAMVAGLAIQSCQAEDVYFIEPEKKSALDNFESLIEKTAPNLSKITERKYNLLSSKSASSKKKPQNLEIETKNALQPLINGSINLLRSFEFSDEEIIKEFGSLDSPEVVLSGIFILAIEKDKQMSLPVASDYDRAVECTLRATGLAGAGVLINEGIKEGLKKLGVKGTLKMVGKIAGRTLSWVGVAWAVGDFVYCMNQ